MKFIIGEPVFKKKMLDCYEVVITTMEGDADGYHELKYTFKPGEEDKMARLIDLLKRMQYYSGFNRWTNKYKHIEDFEELLGDDWPIGCNYGIPDSYDGHTVFFYTESGVKHHVEVRD